jgi:hypothetical protein
MFGSFSVCHLACIFEIRKFAYCTQFNRYLGIRFIESSCRFVCSNNLKISASLSKYLGSGVKQAIVLSILANLCLFCLDCCCNGFFGSRAFHSWSHHSLNLSGWGVVVGYRFGWVVILYNLHWSCCANNNLAGLIGRFLWVWIAFGVCCLYEQELFSNPLWFVKYQ